jgi:hypothetical protein
MRSRLDRLEQRVGLPRCPPCRDRQGRIVFIDGTRLTDGTGVPCKDPPAPCFACGKVPELVIEVVETVVEAVGCDAPPP